MSTLKPLSRRGGAQEASSSESRNRPLSRRPLRHDLKPDRMGLHHWQDETASAEPRSRAGFTDGLGLVTT
jgi:hypothetical protein